MKKSLLISLFCIFALPLFGEAESANRAIVGERPLSEEEQQLLQELRQQEELDADVSNLVEPTRALVTDSPFQLAATWGIPLNWHWVATISPGGHLLEMEDGSHWSVRTSDTAYTYGWRSSDLLEITPSYNLFSSYAYKITNQTSGYSVLANLTVGPLLNSDQRHWVVGFNDVEGHIILENGTVWAISWLDTNLIHKWQVNDTVILGSYDRWFSSYDAILINVPCNHYVRARQL